MSPLVQALLGVALGAVLATAGGFLATQVTATIERRRRATSAALLCGEILSAAQTLVSLAAEASGAGTFDNPLTLRYLRATRREIDLYDRNRELLFNITDAELRARVHSFMVRLSIPLDRLFDAHARMSDGTATADAPGARTELDHAFQYLLDSRQHIPDLLISLQPLARERLDAYRRIDKDGLISASLSPATSRSLEGR